MKTSESVIEISKALCKAQSSITFAIKDAVNPHLKSKYADLPSVIDAIKPSLNEQGIIFIQSAGEMINMHLQLTTRLMHVSGEWIEDTMTMPLVKQDPQGYGSALTYARRYSLAAIVGLYQDDDDGQQSTKQKKEVAKVKSKLGTNGLKEAIKSIKSGTFTIIQLVDDYDISQDQLDFVNNELRTVENVSNPSE